VKRPSHDPSVWHEPALSTNAESKGEDLVGDEPALAAVGGSLRAYGDHYRERRTATSPGRRWGAVTLALALAGPAGILGAFAASLAVGASFAFAVFAVVLVGPITEEFVKVAGPLHLAESRPWLVPAAWVLIAVAVVGGLGFAAIENWVYLSIYIDAPTDDIIRWRWIFGPLIHGTASALAGIGVARMWRLTDRSGAPPTPSVAMPWFIAAVAVHGTYNLLAVILEVTDTI
jgi:RsiW-degrading membrane proteinase PrsW (M82 family)